jgi:hypothetical protein
VHLKPCAEAELREQAAAQRNQQLPPHIGVRARGGRQRDSSGPWSASAPHPGGAKAIAAIEQALALPTGELDHERSILRRRVHL